MQIGEVIRMYRKEKNMTQEEMAKRLGVSTPAVNKWENGNSMPDIALLAPIARLLEVSLDVLLSYQQDLSESEISQLMQELNQRLKEESYKKAFDWAENKIRLYPNSEMLIWQMAAVLDAHRLMKAIPDGEQYDEKILSWYQQALGSSNETIRSGAADSLFHYYFHKEMYDQAEAYLAYFSEQNPERKRKQASVYAKTGRIQEAYKAFEELLFSGYQMLSMVFHSIFMLAIEEKNVEKARKMAVKQSELARLFEMGRYHEISCQLELAEMDQNEVRKQKILQEMMECVDEIAGFTRSELYEHMVFKEVSTEFIEEVKESLGENID